jgi:CRP/FNR family transcriptional regulator, cyclic AMP receptor protein
MAADDVDIPLLASLSARERQGLLEHARKRTWAAGDTVVREGEPGLNVFLIASGHARIGRAGDAALARLGPGDFFGELALIEEEPRTATVTADDDLTCYLVPNWEFRSLLNEHPAIALPMLKRVIARLHQLEHHGH